MERMQCGPYRPRPNNYQRQMNNTFTDLESWTTRLNDLESSPGGCSFLVAALEGMWLSWGKKKKGKNTLSQVS